MSDLNQMASALIALARHLSARRNDVLRKAREHDLPISEKQVTVQRILTPGLMAVYVAADYSVTINLPGYSFDMHFNPTSGNK